MMETEWAREDESLDDLGGGRRILQKKYGYRFTSDAVLLASYARANGKCDCVDLCSGSGIVGILLALKNNYNSLTLLELQEEIAEMSERNVTMNALERVRVVRGDVKKAAELLGAERYDVITCNPPYYRVGEGEKSEDERVAISRHEVALTLAQTVESAGKLLRFGGKLYMVYRADRLAELLAVLAENKLEPKDIVLIEPAKGKEIDVVLVTAKKGAEKGVRVRTFVRKYLEEDLTLLKRK